jgi:hypothetical protein
MAAPTGPQYGEYIQYGSAYLYVNPKSGNLATPTLPVFPFTVQDVEVSFKGKADELRGQLRIPEDVAVGDISITGKFGIGRKDWLLFNQLYFSDLVVTGGTSVSPLEAHTIPASVAYTVTTVPPGSGVFSEDLGVMYAGTGQRLQLVGSLTAAGQYMVNTSTGVYTFDVADASASVLISYSYTLTTGATYEVNNQIQGFGPQLEFFLVDRYQLVAGVANTMWLKSVKCHSLGNVGNKRDKYAMPEIEFTAFAAGPVPGASAVQVFVAAG